MTFNSAEDFACQIDRRPSVFDFAACAIMAAVGGSVLIYTRAWEWL